MESVKIIDFDDDIIEVEYCSDGDYVFPDPLYEELLDSYDL